MGGATLPGSHAGKAWAVLSCGARVTAPGLDRVTVHRQGTDFEACCPCCEEGPELDRLRAENARLRDSMRTAAADLDRLEYDRLDGTFANRLLKIEQRLRAALGGGE